MNNYKQKISLPCQTMEYSPTKWKVGHTGPSCKLICNRPTSKAHLNKKLHFYSRLSAFLLARKQQGWVLIMGLILLLHPAQLCGHDPNQKAIKPPIMVSLIGFTLESSYQASEKLVRIYLFGTDKISEGGGESGDLGSWKNRSTRERDWKIVEILRK